MRCTDVCMAHAPASHSACHDHKKSPAYLLVWVWGSTFAAFGRKGVPLSNCQKHKIDAIFVEIGKIIKNINGNRKRMISVNFIMRKIFKMMGIPYKNIPISKSKKTLAFYDQYWASIMSLIGDKIKSIIE